MADDISGDEIGEAEAEQIRAEFAESKTRNAFWREHYQEFVRRFPDQFVAVSRTDWHIVAAHRRLEGVISLAEEQGFTLGSIWIEFIAATPLHVSL